MKPRPPAKRGSFKVALLSVAVSMWLRPRGNNSPPLQKMRQPLQFPLPPNKRERKHGSFGGVLKNVCGLETANVQLKRGA